MKELKISIKFYSSINTTYLWQIIFLIINFYHFPSKYMVHFYPKNISCILLSDMEFPYRQFNIFPVYKCLSFYPKFQLKIFHNIQNFWSSRVDIVSLFSLYFSVFDTDCWKRNVIKEIIFTYSIWHIWCFISIICHGDRTLTEVKIRVSLNPSLWGYHLEYGVKGNKLAEQTLKSAMKLILIMAFSTTQCLVNIKYSCMRSVSSARDQSERFIISCTL